MPRLTGYWISLGGGKRAGRVDEGIQNDGTFTDVVTASEVRPRPAELVVVSLTEEHADYLGIARAGLRIATDQRRVSISHLTPLGPLELSKLKSRLPKRVAGRMEIPAIGAYRPTPRLWDAILSAIVELSPAAGKSVPILRKLIAEVGTGKGRRAGGLEVFERDAIASAVQVFGGEQLRKRVLRSLAPADDDTPAPFLTRLQNVSLREDPQIIHDAATFPGMELARKYLVGAAELENERGERLTILNCNRQPIETTLGVDLIYYSHCFDSFVLVQYKRMTEQSKGVVAYRPHGDKNYESELSHMIQIQALLDAEANAPEAVASFRLSPAPFFFKLCEAKAKVALDEGMVSGMYIPLALWCRFLESEEARGKRGGISIGWQNCPRHFSSGDFTKLLAAGWIGSTGSQTKWLERIVDAILRDDHMLIFALTSAARGDRDYLRDSFGRFAAEDDPLASR